MFNKKLRLYLNPIWVASRMSHFVDCISGNQLSNFLTVEKDQMKHFTLFESETEGLYDVTRGLISP